MHIKEVLSKHWHLEDATCSSYKQCIETLDHVFFFMSFCFPNLVLYHLASKILKNVVFQPMNDWVFVDKFLKFSKIYGIYREEEWKFTLFESTVCDKI